MKQRPKLPMPSAMQILLKLSLQSFGIALLATLTGVGATGARADQDSFCHDIPAREAVLNEGKEYLLQHGKVDHGTRRPITDDGLASYRLRQHPNSEFQNVSIFTIEHLPLETPQQLVEAESLAEKLECAQHFKSAHRLYLRVLKLREKAGAANIRLAQVLESVARTEILATSNLPFADNKEVGIFDQGAQYESYGVGSRFVGSAIVRNAIRKTVDPAAIKSAGELYTHARAIRRNLHDSNEQLVADLIILGAIKDKLQDSHSAKTFYVEASQLDQRAIKYLAIYALGQKDFALAKEKEPLFLNQAKTNADSASTSILLALYVSEKRASDTLLMLRHAMANSVFVPADVLISTFRIIQPSDLELLTTYINKTWLTAAEPDPDLVTVIEAMHRQGWDTWADTICQSAAKRYSRSIPAFMAIAICYRQLNNQAKALKLYKLILNSIQAVREPSMGAITELSEIATALDSEEMKREPESQTVLLSVSKEIEFQRSALRHRQCLDMAAQLNKTAFDLERSAHNAMAQKLYEQALEIKQLNLTKDDPEIAVQTLDVARTCAAQTNYIQAQSLYESALTQLRKKPRMDSSVTKQALESYGQMLNQMNQQEKAKKIYDEARELSK